MPDSPGWNIATSNYSVGRFLTDGWSSPSGSPASRQASPAGLRLHRTGLFPERRPERARPDADHARRPPRSKPPTPSRRRSSANCAQYPEVRSLFTVVGPASVGGSTHGRRRHQPGPDHRAAGPARRARSVVSRDGRGGAPASRTAGTQAPSARRHAQRVRLRRLRRRADPGPGPGQRPGRSSTQLATPGPASHCAGARAPSDSTTATTICRPSSARSIDWTRAADLGVNAARRGHGAPLGARRLHLQRQPVPAERATVHSDPGPDRQSTAAPLQQTSSACRSVAPRRVVQLGQFTTFDQARIPTTIRTSTVCAA